MKTYLLFCLSLLTCTQLLAQNHEESNYDESKVPAYTLPDVLKTREDKTINSKKAWEKNRRPRHLGIEEGFCSFWPSKGIRPPAMEGGKVERGRLF